MTNKLLGDILKAMFIPPERLSFAFVQLRPEDGEEFERFANAFLLKEIPDLRPVAGMHDRARDAFIYRLGSVETSFLQSSITGYWKKKVRGTIRAIQKNQYLVREFIYCSPLAILGDSDDLRAELRALGVSLDIRDRDYFLAGANSTPKQSELCERFASKYVDPLLAVQQLADASGILLTDREEQLALVYLDLQLKDKTAEMALTKFSFDALVKYALRDSSPQNLQTREEVFAGVIRAVPSYDRARVQFLVNASLDRLVRKKVVNHHRAENGFTLAYPHRTATSEALIALGVEKDQLLSEIVTRVRRVATEIGIDYDYDPGLVARDVLSVLTFYFGTQGQQTAKAIVSGKDYRPPFTDPYELCHTAITRHAGHLSSLQTLGDAKFLDIVPPVIEDVVANPTAVSRSYLRRMADAALLMFFLRESPDIQKTMEKVFQTGKLLVDASYIVPCLAETFLPESQRRFTGLINAAKAFGMSLYIADDGLNELITHLQRIRVEALWAEAHSPAYALAESLMTRAFLRARDSGQVRSVDDFIYRFIGREDPKEDLIDTLQTLFGIEYRSFSEELESLDPQLVGQVIEWWRKLKRRRTGIGDETFDVLVAHDVHAYLLVQSLRRSEHTESKYGYTNWWLTLDHTGFRVQHVARQNNIRFVTPVGSCMSPDFLLRYLSIRPHAQSEDAYLNSVLPLSIELAGVGLVPPELREAARTAMEAVKNEPQYVQRRRVRDVLNSAKAEAGELLNSGVEDTMRSIEESIDESTQG